MKINYLRNGVLATVTAAGVMLASAAALADPGPAAASIAV